MEIRARVEGFLEKKTYEEGGKVKAGQAMFQIDRRSFEAALQQARGALAQQEAKLTNAEATLKRVRPLAEKNAVNQKSSSFLMITGIYSPNDRYDENYVANYANLCILDAERNLFKGLHPPVLNGVR